jgi:hypothetical protein
LQTLDDNKRQREELTVEAATVEDALAQISAELGADAEIVGARKVHRGGVGGFFAKEMVQLTARRRGAGRTLQPLRPRRHSPGIAGVLERLAQDADADDGDFKTALRRELGSDPTGDRTAALLEAAGWAGNEAMLTTVAAQGTSEPEQRQAFEAAAVPAGDAGVTDEPAPVVVGPMLRPTVTQPVAEESAPLLPGAGDGTDDAHPAPLEPEVAILPDPAPAGILFDPVSPEEPDSDGAEVPAWRTAPAPEAPAGMGAVDWSTTALLRAGLPGPIVTALSGIDPADDLAWLEGVAAIVAPYCGPLPETDMVVVGPHAERLAEPLGLPLIQAGEMAPYAGSFCAMVDDSTHDRDWLEYVRGERGIHLVIGDDPWQDLLVAEPVAVSWVGESSVADALYLAFTLGSRLGFGTVDGFVSGTVRVQPTDVAIAVRRMVGRR